MSAAVIAGSFADYRLVKSRSVLQVIVEIPIEQQGAAFAALGYPLPGTEIPVAVARLNSSAGISISNQERTTVAATDGNLKPQPKPAEERERRPWETLSPQQQAGILCADKGFQRWAFNKMRREWWGHDDAEEITASWLRDYLGIRSRRELADNPIALREMNGLRDEFMRDSGRVPVPVR